MLLISEVVTRVTIQPQQYNIIYMYITYACTMYMHTCILYLHVQVHLCLVCLFDLACFFLSSFSSLIYVSADTARQCDMVERLK